MSQESFTLDRAKHSAGVFQSRPTLKHGTYAEAAEDTSKTVKLTEYLPRTDRQTSIERLMFNELDIN